MNICTVADCDRRVEARGLCDPHYRRQMRGVAVHVPVSTRPGLGAEVFERLVQLETDECIIWPLRRSPSNGYGRFYIGRKLYLAHRVALERRMGPPPSPIHQAAHGPCHNPGCMNYRHLRWATPSENQIDRIRDGTINAKLTVFDVRRIRELLDRGVSCVDLAARYGVTVNHMQRIKDRANWPGVEP